MGEKKWKQANQSQQDQVAAVIGKRLADRGQIVEAGWAIHRHYFMPVGLPKDQEMAYRNAFYAGAEHFYSTIMGALDPGAGETDADMRRMALAHKELMAWREQMIIMGLLKPVPGVKQ